MTEMMPGAVTSADLYREMVEARRQLTELVTSSRIAEERHQGQVDINRDVERRMRAVERAWWKITGAAAVISVAVSLVTALIALRGR